MIMPAMFIPVFRQQIRRKKKKREWRYEWESTYSNESFVYFVREGERFWSWYHEGARDVLAWRLAVLRPGWVFPLLVINILMYVLCAETIYERIVLWYIYPRIILANTNWVKHCNHGSGESEKQDNLENRSYQIEAWGSDNYFQICG